MLQLTGSWQWGLRIAPILSFISVILVVFVMIDPPRGESEGSHMTNTSWKKDLGYLLSKLVRRLFIGDSELSCKRIIVKSGSKTSMSSLT